MNWKKRKLVTKKYSKEDWIWLIIGFIIGGYGFFIIGSELLTFSFIKTECKILKSNIKVFLASGSSTRTKSTYHTPDVEYSYIYKDKEYKSSRFNIIDTWNTSSFFDTIDEMIKPYKTGKTATCWVNPRNPSIAVLKRDISYLTILITSIIASLLIHPMIVYEKIKLYFKNRP